ncbi:MAG TPA: hypothetical protein VMV98_01810, partial [Acidobacteriaceae bacterium]|nr:hypothetical protein [Acidobacteriaceae bacterium]
MRQRPSTAESLGGHSAAAYRKHESLLAPLGFEWNKDADLYLIAWTEALENLLTQETSAEFDVFTRKPYRPEHRDRTPASRFTSFHRVSSNSDFRE